MATTVRVPTVCSALALLALACGSKPKKPVAMPVSSARVGDCADPRRGGVVSGSPDPVRADRDLDGDGSAEIVVADRGLCRQGNCYWNLFSSDPACSRYLGTVAGQAIDERGRRGEDGFRALRGWWKVGGGRFFVHFYEYRHGGYRLDEALICRREGDDRLLCAQGGAMDGQGDSL